MSKLWLGSFCPTLLVSEFWESLHCRLTWCWYLVWRIWLRLLRTNGVRLCVSISHYSGLGARMSECFLCCYFKTWLRLVLFSLILVKSWRRLCNGWSGIFFTFSPCVRSLSFLRESIGSTPAVFCMVAMGVLFIVCIVYNKIVVQFVATINILTQHLNRNVYVPIQPFKSYTVFEINFFTQLHVVGKINYSNVYVWKRTALNYWTNV